MQQGVCVTLASCAPETPFIAKRKEKLSKKSTNDSRLFSFHTSLFKTQFYHKDVGLGLMEEVWVYSTSLYRSQWP